MGLTGNAMHTLATLALLLTMSSTPRTPSGQPGPMQPSDFTPAAPSRVVSWQLKRVTPPSPLYVSVDDKLVVGAATSQTNEVVTVNYRLLRASDGVIVPGQFTVKPANTRAVTIQQQQLAEGFLLSVSVKAAVATTRGMTFVRAFLGAGPYGAGQPSYMLMADYVTTAMAPAHPNGRVLAPVEGPGWLHAITITVPPAGSNFTFVLPTNARMRLQGVQATLTTSAAVANRTAALYAFGGAAGSFASLSATAQTASQIVQYFWYPQAAIVFNAAINFASLPIPYGHILSGNNGDQLQSNTLSIQAADQWSAIFSTVEEWLENV